MTSKVGSSVWYTLAAITGGLGLGYVFAGPGLQRFIESSGVNIPTSDAFVDYAWGVAWACVLLLSVFLWPISWKHKKLLAAGWLAKCFMALVVMLPYERQYWGLDCWTYFQRAHLGLADLSPRLMRGGADLVIWLGALHLKIGPNSYHAMKLSFAMIGLWAVYLFYRAGELLVGRYSGFAFWALMLYPSVLFWSSILGKDPLILAAISLNVWGVVNVTVQGKNRYLIAVLAGVGAASAVRVWMGPILILPGLFVLGARIRHVGWRITAVLLIACALSILAPATIDRLRLDAAADLLEATRTVTGGWARANSSLKLDVELNSTWDLLLFTPQSVFIAFFRPLPGDVPNVFGWLAGVENLGLLLVSVWAFFCIRLRYFRNPLFLWGAALLVTWGLAYSVVAYKDLGAAVRYKLQIIPILLGMIAYLIRFPVPLGFVRLAPDRLSRCLQVSMAPEAKLP
jgi:hypothetical protein